MLVVVTSRDHPDYNPQVEYSDLRFWQIAVELFFVRRGLCANEPRGNSFDGHFKYAPKPVLMCLQCQFGKYQMYGFSLLYCMSMSCLLMSQSVCLSGFMSGKKVRENKNDELI